MALLTGVQAQYNLNETSGTRNDTTPNNNDLTDNNTVTSEMGYQGENNSAAHFVAANSEFLHISDAAQTGLDITGSITLGCKMRRSSYAIQTLISKFKYTGSNDRSYGLYIVSDKLRLAVSDDGTYPAGYKEVNGSRTLYADSYYTVMGVYDGTDLRLYVNGVLDGSPVAHTTGIYNSVANFCLGANDNGIGSFMDGDMDMVAVWNRALSSDEALAFHLLGSDFQVISPPSPLFITSKYSGNPIIPQDSGENETYSQTVVYNGTDYKMLFKGKTIAGDKQIYAAESTDGEVYTWLNSRNPVIPKEGLGWEQIATRLPKLIYDSGTYRAYYTGQDNSGVWRVGYATSSDCVSWSKYGSNPILEPSDFSWTADHASITCVIKDGSAYHFWGHTYHISTDTSVLWHSKGTGWLNLADTTTYEKVFDISPTNRTKLTYIYIFSAFYPMVIQYEAQYYMFFTAKRSPLTSQYGWRTHYAYASSLDGPWTMEQNAPDVMLAGAYGAYDQGRIYDPSIVTENPASKTPITYNGNMLYYYSCAPEADESAPGNYFTVGKAELELIGLGQRSHKHIPYVNNLVFPKRNIF
jgi:hypothetical protein